MPTIHLMDETSGRRMPVKPPYGRPYNGCGYCCSTEICGVVLEHLAVAEAPCPALECEDGASCAG